MSLEQQQQQQQQQQRTAPPDTLADRLAYVEALVDMNALVLEAIWPTTSTGHGDIMPLRPFIHQVLKRSRTTYSTLQIAFFYLFRARPAILRQLHHNQHPHKAYIQCGRRMFLASLMVAAKFVQDKTYRNIAWANLAGLRVDEINLAERVFLELLGYRLYVAQATFDQWHTLLHAHVSAKSTPSTTASLESTQQQQQYLFPSSSSSHQDTNTHSSSTTTVPSCSTPALSPSSIASSSACSSPNLPSPSPPNTSSTTQNRKNSKRSLAHLLNSPQELASSRKRPCVSSSSSVL